jgi:hypothetical protein
LGTKQFPDIDGFRSFETMPKDDLHINENHWRRRRLYRERCAHPMLGLGVILFVLAVLHMLGRGLEIPPFGSTARGVS